MRNCFRHLPENKMTQCLISIVATWTCVNLALDFYCFVVIIKEKMFSDVIFCFCAWLKMLDERHSKSNAMLLYRRDCWYPLFRFYTTGTQAARHLSIINENWIFTGNSMTSLFFWLSVDGTLQSSGYMQMWTANNNNKKMRNWMRGYWNFRATRLFCSSARISIRTI